MTRPCQAAGLLALLMTAPPAWAQSTVSPQSDWNGNYGFSSTAEKNLRLLQTDVLRKNEEGYYESLGKTQITSFNNVHYGDQIGTQTNNEKNEIGQQTTAIGAVNNSTNNIDISGRGNINVATSNEAQSRGCQDGRVSIDASLPGGQPTCN
ncbi:hypothetical protein [Aureimonas sp. AU4]|uniref:hypothetical protein n=1 Tax=Aureimonas sp. AU4 TaxID=1638163 RepID=UPI00078543FA|nr:hypothetical protein [Aureimonas sp. AU4]